MSSPLTLIVLGQAYFLGTAPNIQPIESNDLSPISYTDNQLSQPAPYSQDKRADYTYTPGVGAHKIHRIANTWNEARLICEKEGGYLAIINSLAESKAIANLFPTSLPHVNSVNPEAALIGFHDLYEDGQYVTIRGESLKRAGFDVWHTGEPNNFEGPENCGAVWKDGKLNDVKCSDHYAFVCELPASDHVTLDTPIPTLPYRIIPELVTLRDEIKEALGVKIQTTSQTPTTSSRALVPPTTTNSGIDKSKNGLWDFFGFNNSDEFVFKSPESDDDDDDDDDEYY